MSLTKKELARFYANKPKELNTVTVGGNKLAFANFPTKIQQKINNRLAEKDPVLMKAIQTTKFGIIIDGKEVGRDNIKDFEISKPGEISKAGKEYAESHESEIAKIKEVKAEEKPKVEAKPVKIEPVKVAKKPKTPKNK